MFFPKGRSKSDFVVEVSLRGHRSIAKLITIHGSYSIATELGNFLFFSTLKRIQQTLTAFICSLLGSVWIFIIINRKLY